MAEGKRNQKHAESEVRTFTVPFHLDEISKDIIITSKNPSKPSKEQIINQAFQFHSQGNISKAVSYYQLCIDQGFKDYRVFSNYGIILNDLGQLKEAELVTRKAIELKPDLADSYSNLGCILKDLGQLKEAELVTRKAIELKPDLADSHSNLGCILKDLGQLKEAELVTRKAIELKPDYIQAHINLGDILFELGKPEEASISQWTAIKANPSFEFLKAYRQNAKLINKTAFLIFSPLIFDHYRPIIELNPNFFEIIVPDKIDNKVILKIRNELKNKYIKIRSAGELIKNSLFYDKLVSNRGDDNWDWNIVKNNKHIKLTIPVIKLLGKKNIRFMYTAGKNKYTISSYWNKYYDGILCYGPYHEEKFKLRHQISTSQMGYPRFDKYFNPGFERDDIIKKFKCNPKKKTIVWISTWSNLSSTDKYLKEISSLRDDYNIVIRPHPTMRKNDPENYKKLFTVDFNYIDETDEDNVQLYALADLMLFDYGGSMFGSLYLNKSFAFLEMNTVAKNHSYLGKFSSEDYLKSFFPDRIARLGNLKSICSHCLNNPPSNSVMKSLREEFFNTNYQGNSAKRAYDLLISNNWLI